MNELRSLLNEERAYVRFINATDKAVELIWINFTGHYIMYELLNRGGYIDIDTFKHHPWIVRNSQTKDRLHIDKQYVYYPKTTKELFLEKHPHKEFPAGFEARIRAYITIPVHSLRYITLLAIRNVFPDENGVERLELPKELQEDLKKCITHRKNQLSIPVEPSNR